jgi:hypothetical protein
LIPHHALWSYSPQMTEVIRLKPEFLCGKAAKIDRS